MQPAILAQRAAMQQRLREFFVGRGFTEVTTPRVDAEIIPEAHIDPFEAPGLGYLQASPEMHMKRLLCAGSGPIFEFAQCFRRGERGRLHRPEFTMLEWYRPGDDMQAGIALLGELIQATLPTSPSPPRGERLAEGANELNLKQTSYRQAFEAALGIDPHTASLEELQQLTGDPIDDRDEQLNLLIAKHVEPDVGRDQPEVLYHYPATQSALAATTVDEHGIEVAERFELYYRGIELANGYHELTDPVELRRRLVEANTLRQQDGRPPLPLPEKLLAAMTTRGLPPCAGVALGFDRLLMLAVGAESIDQVCGD